MALSELLFRLGSQAKGLEDSAAALRAEVDAERAELAAREAIDFAAHALQQVEYYVLATAATRDVGVDAHDQPAEADPAEGAVAPAEADPAEEAVAAAEAPTEEPTPEPAPAETADKEESPGAPAAGDESESSDAGTEDAVDTGAAEATTDNPTA